MEKVPIIMLDYELTIGLGVLIAIGVVVLTTILLLVVWKLRKRPNPVLLVGLTDSGKTLMFTRFLSGLSSHFCIRAYLNAQTRAYISMDVAYIFFEDCSI